MAAMAAMAYAQATHSMDGVSPSERRNAKVLKIDSSLFVPLGITRQDATK